MRYLFFIFLIGCSAIVDLEDYPIKLDEPTSTVIMQDAGSIEVRYDNVQDPVVTTDIQDVGILTEGISYINDSGRIPKDVGPIDVQPDAIRIENDAGYVDSKDTQTKSYTQDIDSSTHDADADFREGDNFTEDELDAEIELAEATVSIPEDSAIQDTAADVSDIRDTSTEDTLDIPEDAISEDTGLDECIEPGGRVYDCSPSMCDPKDYWMAVSGEPWCYQSDIRFNVTGLEHSILLGGAEDPIVKSQGCMYAGDIIYTQWKGTTQARVCAKVTVQGDRGILINSTGCTNSEIFVQCSVIAERENFDILIGEVLDPGWLHIESIKLENGQPCPFFCES